MGHLLPIGPYLRQLMVNSHLPPDQQDIQENTGLQDQRYYQSHQRKEGQDQFHLTR